MKTFLYSAFLIFISLIVLAVIYLSTNGLETSKFNNLIINEIKKKEPTVELELNKVKIKLDIKKIQLFLSTNKPKIIYQNIRIPISKIKIYSKINKILNSKIEVSQIIFEIEEFKIKDIKKIAVRIKPSNFKTYLMNNLKGGEIEKALFDIRTNKDFKPTEYTASGSIKKIDIKVNDNSTIKNVSFNFILDNSLTLINSINANYNGFLVSNGSIEVKQKKDIQIKGKFSSQFNLKENHLNKSFKNIKYFKKNKIEIRGNLIHNFNLKINNNLKVVDYDYSSSGNITQSKVILKNIIKNKIIKKPIKKIFFEKIKIELVFNKKNKNLLLDGRYSFDNLNYKKFKIKNNLDKKNKNYFIDLNLAESIFLDIINFKSESKKNSNIKVEYIFKNKKFIFKNIDFTQGKNKIFIKNLVLNNKNIIEKISSINVLTYTKDNENNNFTVNFGKKISVLGNKYDATNLLKAFSGDSTSNLFKNINKEVEVQIKKLLTKSKIPLSNLNLIGSVTNGKFDKISAKSDFSKDEYLDISLKKDPNDKMILEVYSDYPQALLSDYKFLEGVKNGKLLYSSVSDDTGSASKLTIENFKVIKAPAFATLLTLADLGGISDLLSGQGMSFDFLEINFKEDNSLTNIEEILALGSSVSLHMKGYIEKKTGLVSLSGTLVPAKMLNNLVSKIPVVGNILVGDEVGEGDFGVSFKMKGLPGKIKTTVNPVKTITPRFITRALEKMKKK